MDLLGIEQEAVDKYVKDTSTIEIENKVSKDDDLMKFDINKFQKELENYLKKW